jgi:hypothetical protein
MAAYKLGRDAEFAAYAAHFVFEKESQRLNKPEVHLFGQSSHVVVALYDHTGDGKGLNHIGIDGALGKPLDVFELVRFTVEYVDEALAYHFAFLLGIDNSGKAGIEMLFGIDPYHVKPEAFVIVQHVAEFVLAQHSVVNEDAGEVFADGTVEQHCCHR